MKKKSELIQIATNVYRTEMFVVKQRLFVLYSEEDNNELISRDTFYQRTPELDAEYESIYSCRKNIDCRRLPSTAYTREYRY